MMIRFPRLFLLLIIFLLSVKVNAQQARIDSLERVLQSVSADTTRLRIYQELLEQYEANAPSEKALAKAMEGMNLARTLGDDFALGKFLLLRAQIYADVFSAEHETALKLLDQSLLVLRKIAPKYSNDFEYGKEVVSVLNAKSYLYWRSGDLNLSLSFYDSTINLAHKVWKLDSTNDKINRILGLAYNSKGAVQWGLGDFTDAIANYFSAIRYFEKTDMVSNLSLTMSNIGLIYNSWGQKDDAQFYFRRSVALANEAKNDNALGYAYNNMGQFMRSVEAYDSALYYFGLSTQRYAATQNLGGIYLNLNGLGETYSEIKDYEKSLNYFSEALALADSTNSSYRKALTLQNIARVLALKGEGNEALKFANECNDLAVKRGYKEIAKDNYLIISDIYAKLQRFDKAYANYQLYSSYKDSLFSEEKFQQVASLREQFELEKKESENELLRRDALIQNQKLRQERLEKYGLLAIMILVLLFALYFVITNLKIRRINNSLTSKNEEVTFQKEELSLKAEELKKSNEIKNLMFSIVSHDLRGPISNLSGLVELLGMKSISKDELDRLLPSIATNIGNVADLTDNVLYWARSQMEGVKAQPQSFDLGEHLAAKLQLYEKSADEKGIHFTNEVMEGLSVFADPYMIELIARNLVSNAVKFSNRGDKIKVSAKLDRDFAVVTIEDTGQGIPPEHIDKIFADMQFTTVGTRDERGIGLGLTMSKYFVEVIGGKIWVESAFRMGSSFHFTIPTSDKAKDLA